MSEKAKILTNVGQNSIRGLSVGAIVKEKLLWGYLRFHKQFPFPQEEPPSLQS